MESKVLITNIFQIGKVTYYFKLDEIHRLAILNEADSSCMGCNLVSNSCYVHTNDGRCFTLCELLTKSSYYQVDKLVKPSLIIMNKLKYDYRSGKIR